MNPIKPELFPDCDIIVRFLKSEQMGSLGTFEQTYYEMGSTQSQPCQYKSPTVTIKKAVFTKQGRQFRGDTVPAYGPVGENNCLRSGDRGSENYSMLKSYESLSAAKKSCSMNNDCDIIVEIDRSKGLYFSTFSIF